MTFSRIRPIGYIKNGRIQLSFEASVIVCPPNFVHDNSQKCLLCGMPWSGSRWQPGAIALREPETHQGVDIGVTGDVRDLIIGPVGLRFQTETETSSVSRSSDRNNNNNNKNKNNKQKLKRQTSSCPTCTTITSTRATFCGKQMSLSGWKIICQGLTLVGPLKPKWIELIHNTMGNLCSGKVHKAKQYLDRGSCPNHSDWLKWHLYTWQSTIRRLCQGKRRLIANLGECYECFFS